MRVYNLSDTEKADQKVSFNGLFTTLKEMRERFRFYLQSDPNISHYLVASKTNVVMMYFTGMVASERLYVHSIVPLTDKVFAGWKAVLKELKCVELDVTTQPEDFAFHEACEQTGLTALSQRIKFTVERAAPLPEMTYLRLDELTLSQSVSLGKMAIARDGKRAADMLRDLAYGLANGVVVPNDNGDIVGALFYGECKERLNSEGTFIDAVPGSRNWLDWSILLLNAFIREAKRLRKPCVQAFPLHVSFKSLPHVTTEVVSLHYGIAGRGIGQVY